MSAIEIFNKEVLSNNILIGKTETRTFILNSTNPILAFRFNITNPNPEQTYRTNSSFRNEVMECIIDNNKHNPYIDFIKIENTVDLEKAYSIISQRKAFSKAGSLDNGIVFLINFPNFYFTENGLMNNHCEFMCDETNKHLRAVISQSYSRKELNHKVIIINGPASEHEFANNGELSRTFTRQRLADFTTRFPETIDIIKSDPEEIICSYASSQIFFKLNK